MARIKTTTISAVMHFCKCSDGSTLASGKIARFLSSELTCGLIDTAESARELIRDANCLDVLYVVNSPFGFCDWREEAVEIACNTKRCVWVQNDYAIKPPSQFKKAAIVFDDVFTTIPSAGTYIDWNRLTYSPLEKTKNDIYGVFYHGAFRENRTQDFMKYLVSDSYNVTISSTINGVKKFAEFEKNELTVNAARYLGPVTLEQMSRFQVGLYIEDKNSHSEFHSLANRFYEYLSAGLAIAIDINCSGTFRKSGLKGWEQFVVSNENDLKVFVDNAEQHAAKQKKLWSKDYVQELRNDLKGAL